MIKHDNTSQLHRFWYVLSIFVYFVRDDQPWFFHLTSLLVGLYLDPAEGGLHASLPVRGMSGLAALGGGPSLLTMTSYQPKTWKKTLSCGKKVPLVFGEFHQVWMTLDRRCMTGFKLSKSEKPLRGLRWPLESSIWSWSLGLSWSCDAERYS